jgi:hypothetical protein
VDVGVPHHRFTSMQVLVPAYESKQQSCVTPSQVELPQATPAALRPASDVSGLSLSHAWVIAKFPTIDAIKYNLIIRCLPYKLTSCVVADVCLNWDPWDIHGICLKNYGSSDSSRVFPCSFDACDDEPRVDASYQFVVMD